MKLIANEMAQGPSNISTLEEEPDLSIGTRVNTVPSGKMPFKVKWRVLIG